LCVASVAQEEPLLTIAYEDETVVGNIVFQVPLSFCWILQMPT
jgi:hypothetical protein